MKQDNTHSSRDKAAATGIAIAAPFISLALAACLLLSIAGVIVLALIPAYLPRKTINSVCPAQCTSGCTQQCLRANAYCNPITKNITIATINSAAPLISQSGSNPPVGLDVDLMNIIASIYGFNFVYQYKQFAELIPTVQNDKNTISISSQTDTRAREQLVDFADFFRSGTGFIVRSNYNQVINSLSDLCGKTVAVLATSTFQTDVTNQNANCGGNPITIQIFPSTAQAISAVQNGNADVALDDDVFIPTVVSQSNNQLKVSGQSYGVAPYGILCNKQNQALCCLLVNAINYLIQQGIYEQLLNKYSYTYAKNGICPSRLNIDGTTCLSTCTPTNTFCQSKLS